MIQQRTRGANNDSDVEMGISSSPRSDGASTRNGLRVPSRDQPRSASPTPPSAKPSYIVQCIRFLRSLTGQQLLVCVGVFAFVMLLGVLLFDYTWDLHWKAATRGAGYGVDVWWHRHDTSNMIVEGGPKRKDNTYYIAIVSDLDKASKRKEEKTWISYLKRGELSVGSDGKWKLKWVDKDEGFALASRLNEKGRGMELSDLIVFQNKLMTVDDRTGVVYEILRPWGLYPGTAQDGVEPAVTPRYILADGSGESYPLKGFKGEWMAVKDGELIVGAHGREFTSGTDGFKIETMNPTWVKIISSENQLRHENWEDKFAVLRKAVNASFPGYMEHEAAAWSPVRREWLFLPRRLSVEPYDEVANQFRGSSIAMLTDENFSSVRVVHLKQSDGSPLETMSGSKGFSSCAFLPNTDDSLVMTLRTIENEQTEVYESFISIFSLETGKVVFQEEHIGAVKYEGLSFF